MAKHEEITIIQKSLKKKSTPRASLIYLTTSFRQRNQILPANTSIRKNNKASSLLMLFILTWKKIDIWRQLCQGREGRLGSNSQAGSVHGPTSELLRGMVHVHP